MVVDEGFQWPHIHGLNGSGWRLGHSRQDRQKSRFGFPDSRAIRNGWGTTASPVLHRDRLLIRTSARDYCIQSSTAAAKLDRPEKLTATIGDVLIRIDGPKLWTLSGIDFQNSKIAVEESAYGSVLNINGVGILGSAHVLDVPGKPGEVEKEPVSLIQFFSR